MTALYEAAQQALEALLTPGGAQACSTCQNGPENEYCCRREMWSAVDALRAALAQQDEPETCTWWQDGDSDSGTYSTSCGHYFSITDGTPEDNKMSHCCYCGKKLVQELITEDDDERS